MTDELNFSEVVHLTVPVTVQWLILLLSRANRRHKIRAPSVQNGGAGIEYMAREVPTTISIPNASPGGPLISRVRCTLIDKHKAGAPRPLG